MGMFFKKKIIGQYPHEVLRKDWENVMEALFRNTIANYAKGVGIICNTNRQDPADGAGTVQQELVYHIRKQRIDEVRKGLKKLDNSVHLMQVIKDVLNNPEVQSAPPSEEEEEEEEKD